MPNLILRLKDQRLFAPAPCILACCLGAASLMAQPTATGTLPERLTIDQAVQEALEHNLGRLADLYNVSVAEARIITARLRPNPVFSAGYDYQDFLGTGYSKEPSNNAGPPEYNFRVDFVLERGRKREHRIELAESAKSVAELQLLDATRLLTLDVQSAFVDVLLAKENLAVVQESLKALNEIAKVNEVRVKTGDLAGVELFRTQVAALQFQNQVRQTALRVRTTSNRLQTLLGRKARSASFDVTGPLRADRQPITLDELRQMAITRRPDIQTLRRDQARSLADLRLQLAQGKIDFTVGTQYHHQYGNAHGNALGFFFSAPLPVFNRNQGEIARAEREQQQIQRRIAALELNIATEVENTYEQYSTARSLLETVERDMLGKAHQVRDIMDYSYRRGEASFVEFLDAQRALNETLQTYNEARAEYARNLYVIDSVSARALNP